MTNDLRAKRIVTLAEEIRQRCNEGAERKVWFFWSKNTTKRTLPNEADYYIPIRWNPSLNHIMFVAPNPSTGEYTDLENKDRLRMFLDGLTEHNLAKRIDACDENDKKIHVYYDGCLVTDLIKTRLEGSEAKKSLEGFEGSIWEDYLKEEIHIVDPVLIVAMGETVYRLLRKMDGLDRPLEQIYHYGSFRFRQRICEWRKQMDRVYRVCCFIRKQSLAGSAGA